LLSSEDGAFASLTYGGYGHFDSDEFTGWIGEMGQQKEPQTDRKPRQFADAAAEAAFKNARNYGGSSYTPPAAAPAHHQHFGLVLVSCERADLRPQPDGVMIYQHGAARLEPLPPPSVPRGEVIDELYDAVVNNRAPLHDGRWAMATLEVCVAMLRSARSGADIALSHQTGLPEPRA
jgi:phthalate 4,5-cis-dihydrodiol dehydrogenase